MCCLKGLTIIIECSKPGIDVQGHVLAQGPLFDRKTRE